MDENDFKISNCERKSLGTGVRISQVIYGLLVIFFCIRIYSPEWIPLMTIGFMSIAYGLIGKEPYKTRNSFSIIQSKIIIKRSFERTIIINTKDIRRITLELYDLQVDYSDYVKNYNLSWLSKEEHQKLKERLINV